MKEFKKNTVQEQINELQQKIKKQLLIFLQRQIHMVVKFGMNPLANIIYG